MVVKFKESSKTKWKHVGLRLLFLAEVLSATFIVYLGTTRFQFVYDDHEQIVENARVQSWQYVPTYFTQQVWSYVAPKDPGNYYRPVFLLWLRINHALFGLRPAWWHLTTILAHLMATLLVFYLALLLIRDHFSAGVAALIFGLHPVHVEAVAWVSGVTEPLMAVWFIGAFLCYAKWRAGPHKSYLWFAAALFLFVLALFTKETALIFPVLILAWEWIFKDARWVKADWSRPRRWIGKGVSALFFTLPFWVLTGAYLTLRIVALNGFSHTYSPLPWRTVFLTIPSVLLFYLRLLFWPFGLSVFYDLGYVTRPGLLNFVFPIIVVGAVAIALVWWSRHSRTVAFAAVWLVLPLLPVLDFRVFGEAELAHDRYLYLPSVGFAIIVAVLLDRLRMWQGRRVLGRPAIQVAAVIAIAVVLAFGTLSQSSYWADDLTLAYRGSRVAPGNFRAMNLFAIALEHRGYNKEAAKMYQKAIALKPNFWAPYYNLGRLYYQTGMFDDAERYLRAAIRVDPSDPREYGYLAMIEFRRGKAEKAAALMRRATEIQPDDASAHVALGFMLKSEGDLKGAKKEFSTALVKDPRNGTARQQLAELGSSTEHGTKSQKAPAKPKANQAH